MAKVVGQVWLHVHAYIIWDCRIVGWGHSPCWLWRSHACCELPYGGKQGTKSSLFKWQQDTDVLSLTACKKWMLPIVTWTWKGFLPQSGLEVRLQPWPTPWLPLSDETLKQRAQPIQAWTPDPQTRWYKKCMLLYAARFVANYYSETCN